MSRFVRFGNLLVVPYDGLWAITERSARSCTVIHECSPFDLDMGVEEAYQFLRKYELEELPLYSSLKTSVQVASRTHKEKSKMDPVPRPQDSENDNTITTATGVTITSEDVALQDE